MRLDLLILNLTISKMIKRLMSFVLARGTGEPGPFGVVVGDLLVEAVTKAVPGSRGYAVQV